MERPPLAPLVEEIKAPSSMDIKTFRPGPGRLSDCLSICGCRVVIRQSMPDARSPKNAFFVLHA